MLSISNNVSNEIIINKSKFITFLYRVDSLEDVNSYISDLNIKYIDSTHICYAYILDNVKRFNDDGEPGGTAGMPILNVLENNNLNHVLCCVVRYFGGIKLGAGGLVRAYSNSCSEIVLKSSIVNLVPGKICSFIFNYDNTKVIDNILKDNIISKEYGNLVCYSFKIDLDNLDNLDSELSKYGEFKVLEDCYIEKKAV